GARPPPRRDRGPAPRLSGLAPGRRRDPGRPDAPDAGPEGRGLGRGGPEAGPRDQEPPDADPAFGAADPEGALEGRSGPGAGRDGVHLGHRPGGGGAQEPGG